jgi:hypothetical protein
VYFLFIEDETALLQVTIFEGIYRRYGHIVYQRTASPLPLSFPRSGRCARRPVGTPLEEHEDRQVEQRRDHRGKKS